MQRRTTVKYTGSVKTDNFFKQQVGGGGGGGTPKWQVDLLRGHVRD